MSTLTYRGLDLQLVRTVRYERDAVYSEDRTTYHYTRHKLEAVFLYNPATTAYIGDDDGQTPPVPPPTPVEQFPANTDRAIRFYLMQPRGQLLYKSDPSNPMANNDGVILDTPATGFQTDADNGPRPLYCHVKQIVGTRTWLVVYGIECAIVGCPGETEDALPPALLSHRWTERHSVDADYFTTRIIQGRAKFRTDVLLADGVPPDYTGDPATYSGLPDDFRFQLFHGIPENFKRENIEVIASSDGSEIQYQITDREQYLSVGDDKPGTRYEGFLALTTQPNSAGNVLIGNVTVRAYGGPNTTPKDLFDNCVVIASSKIDFSKFTLVYQSAILQDLFKPYVELTITVFLGKGQQNLNNAGLFAPPDGVTFMTYGISNFADGSDTTNPLPQGDNLSRGAFVGKLAAAALTDACGGIALLSADEPIPADDHTGDGEQTSPPVSVSVASTTLPEEENFLNDLSQSGIWTEFKIDTRYSADMMTLQAPVASNDDCTPAEFIKVASALGGKTVSWTAERCGDTPPVYPTPDDGDPNSVLLSTEISPCAVELAQDSVSWVFRVSGVYHYGQRVAKKIGVDKFEAGSIPILSDQSVPTSLPASLADADILNNPNDPAEPPACASTSGGSPGTSQ